ncbi:MAG TPA: hypothetical protein VL426_06030 [Candidatus Binatia bacterium]|jgi:hypothetical protein|nr:hypothetical protein [Candidatus Binatia bacterium]
MSRSLFSEQVRTYAPRVLRIAGWGLVTLLISAVLVSFRILLCDQTDIVWDHPSMFPEIVREAYSPDSRSEWGPIWDVIFVVVPAWIYVGVFVPKLWEPDEDEYAPYRRTMWDELRERVPPEPPALEWGYAEYEVAAPPRDEPVIASRTPTLRGFPAVRPPAEPAKAPPSQEEIDDAWKDM